MDLPIGSTFEWQPPSGSGHALPAGSQLYATGRGALVAVCQQTECGTVWLPSYGCGGVADALAKYGFQLRFYEDLPTSREPEWHTLKPSSNEAVVAINLFGVRGPTPWKMWQAARPDVALIEDHTHDPLSTWARQSTADYAFASLRKTVPIPDGAMLWSPQRRPVPEPSGNGLGPAAAYAYAGMILKKAYLANGASNNGLHQQMRDCQQQGEDLLSEACHEPISAWSRQFLSTGLPVELRRLREQNVRHFLRDLQELADRAGARPIFLDWPTGHCPFNPVLLFENHELREACRAQLIRDRVFAPVHWPPSAWMSERAADLAARLLTIPLDFRCAPSQHPRILNVLRTALGSPSALSAA